MNDFNEKPLDPSTMPSGFFKNGSDSAPPKTTKKTTKGGTAPDPNGVIETAKRVMKAQKAAEEPETKARRGRPLGSTKNNTNATTPPTTPKRITPQNSPRAPNQPQTHVDDGVRDLNSTKRLAEKQILIKKLERLAMIYPFLASVKKIIPHPSVMENLDVETLRETLKVAKASTSSVGESEYKFVSMAFFGVLKSFENIALFLSQVLVSLPGGSSNPLVSMLDNLGRLPSGTFAQYVQESVDSGDEIGLSLQEISVDVIGYMPNSPYARLAYLMAYKLYDYNVFMTNDRVRRQTALFSEARSNPDIVRRMEEVQAGGASVRRSSKRGDS